MTADPRLEAAHRLILELAASSKEVVDPERLERTLADLGAVSAEIQAVREGEARLQEVADALFGMAALDFSHRPALHEDGTVLDAVVGCVNMLSEELADYHMQRARIETDLKQRVAAATEFLREILMAMPGSLVVLDRTGRIELVNERACDLLEANQAELVGSPIAGILGPNDVREIMAGPANAGPDAVLRAERLCRTRSGARIATSFSTALRRDATGAGAEAAGVICIVRDIRDYKRLELELRHAQKLESVGCLAAGIAHEINTPVQFVGDSVFFARDAVRDVLAVVDQYRKALRSVEAGAPAARAVASMSDAERDADLAYVSSKLPEALDNAIDGVGRVTTIVRSMQEFARPDQREMTRSDLNRAIQSTLTVARNQYKHVADLDVELGDLPPVSCYLGEVNQAVLAIIVNAAHAIGSVVGGASRQGRITVRTRQVGDDVLISIGDTGGGIPEAIRDRIFDPFFTTKAVGQGRGQGLAIAHSVIVEKHHGSLTFETEVGVGTTFFIRLPIRGVPARASEVLLAV